MAVITTLLAFALQGRASTVEARLQNAAALGSTGFLAAHMVYTRQSAVTLTTTPTATVITALLAVTGRLAAILAIADLD